MVAVAFSFGWVLGRWHGKRNLVPTEERDDPDGTLEGECQANGKGLGALPPTVAGMRERETADEMEAIFFVSRKGAKVHQFDHCGGLGTADKNSLQMMTFCKHCLRMKRTMLSTTGTSGSSSTSDNFRPEGISKRDASRR